MDDYITVDGDMVDEIAQRKYGATTGVTEAIYDANRGLAAYGPILPAGVRIKLPSLTAQQSLDSRVKLWE